MTTPIPDALWNSVVDGIKTSVNALDDLLFDTGAFVASTNDLNPIQTITRANLQAVCRQWSQDAAFPVGPDAAYSSMCDDYLADEGFGKTPGNFIPPYTGGQCAVPYTVQWSYVIQPGNITATPSRSGILGPLGSITGRSEACSTQFGQGFTTFSFATDANGVEVPGFGNGICQIGIDSITYTGATVSRDDGQPDVCGDPPSTDYESREPSGGTPPPGYTDIDITIPTPVGDFDVTVTLNPDGTFTISSGDNQVTIDPTQTDGGDPDSESRGEPDNDNAQTSSDEVTEGENDGCTDGGYLSGVLVEILDTDPGARVEFGQRPLFYTAGWLAFTGDNPGLEFTGQRIISDNQWFPAPATATGFVWKVSKGYRCKFTPYCKEL